MRTLMGRRARAAAGVIVLALAPLGVVPPTAAAETPRGGAALLLFLGLTGKEKSRPAPLPASTPRRDRAAAHDQSNDPASRARRPAIDRN